MYKTSSVTSTGQKKDSFSRKNDHAPSGMFPAFSSHQLCTGGQEAKSGSCTGGKGAKSGTCPGGQDAKSGALGVWYRSGTK